ncbi:MAG: ABC transporter permease [Clostridia bacterium]|nr:ABC transporter permease [Clostridia bacterium]
MEDIKLALRGIWSHKLRSVLTMLGIIIGIASIIAIVSTINGTNEQIKKNLIGDGSNAVKVSLYNQDYEMDFSVQKAPEGVAYIGDNLLQKIENLDEVETACTYHNRTAYSNIFYQNTSLAGGTLIGSDMDYLEVYNYEVLKGRAFSEDDMTQRKKVAIIDENTAENIFPNAIAIGKIIEIEKEPFTVIGIMSKKEEFAPTINSIQDYYTYNTDYTSGTVLIPDSCWPTVYQFDEPQFVAVKAVNTDNMTAAGNKTAELLNNYYHLDADTVYKGSSVMEQAKQIQALSDSTNKQLVWIAAISLLVGGIGVVNIMLVSVTERTPEIGLKKALGAVNSRILVQFLVEAAVLTSLGGILGVGAGMLLSVIIGNVSDVPILISPWSILLSVGVSVGIGLVFGLLPAIKASRLDPIVALQRRD